MCSWWYGIGAPPTAADVRFAARHYEVVVLNAWETAALRELHRLNPRIKVLVYKDLSSTRNYPGTVDDGVDAHRLPTGLGYQAVQRTHPEWFAVDTAGRRIEWADYPQHWQMAVWFPGYQRAWTAAVTAEVVAEGWDGVLADNDFHTLHWYSDAVLAHTADQAGTDRLLRRGLQSLLKTAGPALRRAGKVLVPNISESHLAAQRWRRHSRFGGGMEENFALRTDNGLVTFKGTEWREMRAGAASGRPWQLLMTRSAEEGQQRVGYAAAALLAGRRTCWATSSTEDYSRPGWSRYQDLRLGVPRTAAVRERSGAWTRRFTRGWAAVNPTNVAVRVRAPMGMVTVDGRRVRGLVRIPAFDGLVLLAR
ncbi:putative glycoside hydrolase [Amycolatopsis sp. cmx-4-61]|uniref:putative glycoside hydrolase n=1 Tax=Amycolatopsis sp. cmx-4-61 TaxID=2790937 RepID=UPI00397CECAD